MKSILLQNRKLLLVLLQRLFPLGQKLSLGILLISVRIKQFHLL
nr:MAG TPA: hypothetical protein [Bacteriophage sp.]